MDTLNETLGNLKQNVSILPQEESKARQKICETCPHYKKLMKVCGECGCFIPAKVKFYGSTCPKGKW